MKLYKTKKKQQHFSASKQQQLQKWHERNEKTQLPESKTPLRLKVPSDFYICLLANSYTASMYILYVCEVWSEKIRLTFSHTTLTYRSYFNKKLTCKLNNELRWHPWVWFFSLKKICKNILLSFSVLSIEIWMLIQRSSKD